MRSSWRLELCPSVCSGFISSCVVQPSENECLLWQSRRGPGAAAQRAQPSLLWGKPVLRVSSQDMTALVHTTDFLFLFFYFNFFKNVYSFVVVVLGVDFDIRERQECSKQKAKLAF